MTALMLMPFALPPGIALTVRSLMRAARPAVADRVPPWSSSVRRRQGTSRPGVPGRRGDSVTALQVHPPRVHRSGAGEPLVLLHGLGSSSVSWRPVLGRLSARHSVLAVDLPGFGDSPALLPGQRPTPQALADAVEHALNDAQLDSAHLCGNSLGGWVALELARRERARSVVAISPAGFWTERERRYALAALKVAHRQARLVDPVAGAAMAFPPLRVPLFAQVRSLPWRISRSDAVEEIRMQARVPDFPETRDVTLDGRRAEGLEAIKCPVLVLWGTRDLLLPPRQAARAVRAIPGATLGMLPGLGHIPMSDDPGTVAEAILRFTARAAATSTASLSAPPAEPERDS